MAYYKTFYVYQDNAGRWHWQREGRNKTYCSNGGEGFATQAEAQAKASACFFHEFERESRAANQRNAAREAAYIHCRRAIAEEFNVRYEYSLHAADGKQIGESFAAKPGEARALQQMHKLKAISCADLLRIEARPMPGGAAERLARVERAAA